MSKSLAALLFNIIVPNLIVLANQFTSGYNQTYLVMGAVWIAGLVFGYITHLAFHMSTKVRRLQARLEDVVRARMRYVVQHGPADFRDDKGFTTPHLTRIETLLKEIETERRKF